LTVFEQTVPGITSGRRSRRVSQSMIVRWEYNTVAMAKAQKMVDVYEMLEKHGEKGWELVCILDQSSDKGLEDHRDARIVILKRPKP
jgi:hypothetical protein